MTDSVDPTAPRYSPQTELIHGGTQRSQFGETAEALYLTSGYVYDSAEQAAARMSGHTPAPSRNAMPSRCCAGRKPAMAERLSQCAVVASRSRGLVA